jgi:hypothetical protein
MQQRSQQSAVVVVFMQPTRRLGRSLLEVAAGSRRVWCPWSLLQPYA